MASVRTPGLIEIIAFVRQVRQYVTDVALGSFQQRHIAVLALGLTPAVVQQFVVDLRRIAFAHHVGRDRIDYRLEEVGQPPAGGDRLVQP